MFRKGDLVKLECCGKTMILLVLGRDINFVYFLSKDGIDKFNILIDTDDDFTLLQSLTSGAQP